MPLSYKGPSNMFYREIYLCLFFIVLWSPAVQGGGSVLYSTTRVCGLKGTSVVLPCTYHYSWIGGYIGGEWYEEKSGSVSKYNPPVYDCGMKIDKLSDDHSGVYHFRFYTTLHRSWITSTSGVMVFVTDLAVREDPDVGHLSQIKLNCSTSCSLGLDLYYIWYKNGQHLQDKTSASILLDTTKHSEEGSYSCAIRGYEEQRSPAVCAPDTQCWGVTYMSKRICALMRSSVDISCTYKYPRDHSINKTFWFNHKSNQQPEDLRLDSKYVDHMEYLGNTESNCTVRLKDIRMSHSGEYGFRFITDQGGNHSGLPGVHISVTALQLLVHPDPATKGESVTLTCNTTCSLSDNPSFIWYKNGQPLTFKHTTRNNKLHLSPVSSEDAGSYSCAVRGHENLPSSTVALNVKIRYAPRNTSALVSPSGNTVEGSSVNLTCSSDANPPVSNYTWYKSSGNETILRGTGPHLQFTLTSGDGGVYHCEALNEVGSQNSTGVEVIVGGAESPILLPRLVCSLLLISEYLLLTVMLVVKYYRAQRDDNDDKRQHAVVEA